MKKLLAFVLLYFAGSIALANPSVVCHGVVKNEVNQYSHLELSNDMQSLVLTAQPMPGAPVFNIETVSNSEKDQLITMTGKISQAIACAGGCAIRSFDLKISTTRVFPNGKLTIVTKGFDESTGRNTESEYEQSFLCAATDVEKLPAYKK